MAEANVPKPLSCAVCGRKFFRGDHLRRHASSHTNIRPFQCSFCQRRFARKDVRDKHLTCCNIVRSQSLLLKPDLKASYEPSENASSGLPCNRHQRPLFRDPMGYVSASIHRDVQNILSSQVAVMESENMRTRTITNLERKPENQRTFDQVVTSPADNPIDTRAYVDVECLSWPDIFNSSSPQCLETGHLSFDPWGPFPGMWDLRLPELAIDEKVLDWELCVLSSPHIDPFEYHRLKIIEFLHAACLATSLQLACFSAANAKLFFRAYFLRFHPTSPILHIPTFDINQISTSLYFAMLIVGGLYSGDAEKVDIIRSVWHFAESYVSAQEVQSEESSVVETTQALFLLAHFNIFCMREPGQHPTYDFSKLVNTATRWNIFNGDKKGDLSADWRIWVAAELKKRIAFFIWFLDCGLMMYFGDRPSIPLYGVRHSLPCHEDIWSASTTEEWEERRNNMPTNGSKFPLLLSTLLSPDIPHPPPNVSVLGAFILLHGLHIQIWEMKQYEQTSEENDDDPSIVFQTRNKEVQDALAKWRDAWDAALLHSSSRNPPLYQKCGLAFWTLAKYFNGFKDSQGHRWHCGGTRQVLEVGRLLQAILLTRDNENANYVSARAETVMEMEDEWDRSQRDASVDAMNLKFILYDKNQGKE